jgi:hypothetical protein
MTGMGQPGTHSTEAAGRPASAAPHKRRSVAATVSSRSTSRASLLDHLVGAHEHGIGHVEAEGLGGFQVDHGLVSGRRLYRQMFFLKSGALPQTSILISTTASSTRRRFLHGPIVRSMAGLRRSTYLASKKVLTLVPLEWTMSSNHIASTRSDCAPIASGISMLIAPRHCSNGSKRQLARRHP